MYSYENKKTGKVKRFFRTLLLIAISSALSILLYKMYEGIEINTYGAEQNVEISRLSQTVDNLKKESKEIADVVEEVSSCVVGISKIKNAGGTIFLKDSATSLGLGTGVIISENGYILSNEHVTGAKYSNCYITLEDGKTYTASVIWSDEAMDLSISKINIRGLKYAKLGDSDNIRVGEKVYAIGNPIGFEFQRTVTSGIISATDRTLKIEENNKVSYMEDLIQTDATINPGNSGGPLINVDGNIIGITSVKITSAEGIGFAVPVNIVKPILEKLLKDGKFEEANLGIFAYDKDIIPYVDSNIKFDKGIYVEQISSTSPVKSSLKVGDIILKIDDLELNKMCDLRCYIYSKYPDDEVSLTLYRNGKQMEVRAKLKSKA